MRGKRTDAETKAKIIEIKLNDPDKSTRDIEKEMGIAHETIANVLREDLAQVSTHSEQIASFIDANKRIIAIGQRILETKIPVVEIEGMTDLNSLSAIMDKAHKQNQLTEGKATERHEFVDVSIMSPEERLEYIKSLTR